MKPIQSLIFSVIISCLFGASYAEATTYTVKAGGGGNYTSISACASAAAAGDTCTIFAGSYSGWTQGASGSAGSPITFTTNPGDAVTVTSGVTISGRSYITLSGFTMTAGVLGDSSSQHNIIDRIHFNVNSGTVSFKITDSGNAGGSDNVFSNNVITITGNTGSGGNVYVFGDRNRFENNEISGGGADAFEIGGANVVVRGNYFHDVNGSSSAEHIDFIQLIGGNNPPTLSFTLVENNIEKNCINQCHFVQLRSIGAQGVADTIIVRYNYAYNLDSAFASYGNHNDGAATVPNGFVYNNTVPLLTSMTDVGNCVEFDSGYGTAINNICYSAEPSENSPIYASQGGFENGNIAYNPGFSGTWGAPYSSEATYATLRNQNPLFANFPATGALQATSPAIGHGVALTTVATGDTGSGTSLIVNNAHGLQPGWAGTQADWVRVGSTNTVQITAVNYTTNTLTLASSIGRSSGDPVYLYKNSNGQIVLFGSAPDIGAYQYFAPATNLGAIAH